MELFDRLLSPIFYYGSEVWGFHIANGVENVHIRYCESIVGVRHSTQNNMVRTELGRIDMYYTILVNVMKYWSKVITDR